MFWMTILFFQSIEPNLMTSDLGMVSPLTCFCYTDHVFIRLIFLLRCNSGEISRNKGKVSLPRCTLICFTQIKVLFCSLPGKTGLKKTNLKG